MMLLAAYCVVYVVEWLKRLWILFCLVDSNNSVAVRSPRLRLVVLCVFEAVV